MSQLRVVSFDLNSRVAWLSDDRQVPITNLFDWWGEETDDTDLVDRFVAGSDETGWFACPMELYEKALIS